MKFKRIMAGILAALSLSAAPAAFAETIAPTTAITNSIIGELNQMTNIWSFNFGSGESTGDSVIMPFTVINETDAELVNIINNIISVNCNIDISDVSELSAQIKEDILRKMGY